MMMSRCLLPRPRLGRAASAFLISALNFSATQSHTLHFLRPLNTDHLVGPTSSSGGAQLPKFHVHFYSSSQSEDGEEFPAGLRRDLMPRHVAVILDGNKRWAERRGLGSEAGHDAGLHTLLEIMGLCAKWGVKVATFFLFSSENWRRPKEEIDFVMFRFQKMLTDEIENMIRQGIRITTIGNTTLLSNSLQEVLEHTKEATKSNTKTQVIFAISYSGQDDIVQACQNMARKARDGVIEPKDITKSLIEQELETNITTIPCPDLLIRTSGELRISNFLLWQLAYSELYFTNTLWPDFRETEFIEALKSFQQRRRRFGGR